MDSQFLHPPAVTPVLMLVLLATATPGFAAFPDVSRPPATASRYVPRNGYTGDLTLLAPAASITVNPVSWQTFAPDQSRPAGAPRTEKFAPGHAHFDATLPTSAPSLRLLSDSASRL